MYKGFSATPNLYEYGVENSNCYVVPLSFSTGLFDAKNYLFFNLLWAFEVNWGIGAINEITDNPLLEILGLNTRSIQVSEKTETIEAIRTEINNGSLVLIPVRYNKVFYSRFYMTDYQFVHPIVVTGYDNERHIFEIYDSDIKYDVGAIALKGETMLKLQITDDMLFDIFSKSSETFTEEYTSFRSKLFSMDASKEKRVTSFYEVFSLFTRKGHTNSVIKNFLLNPKGLSDGTLDPESVRRCFFGSIVMMLDIIQKRIPYEHHLSNEYIEFSEKFIKHRNILTSKIIAYILRDRDLPAHEKQITINEIDEMDKALFEFLEKLSCSMVSASPVLINYAEGAIVTADSVYMDNGGINDAQKVINGSWSSLTDRWLSSNVGDHWICVDLKKKRDIVKIVVRHDIDPLSRTVNYSIQGSDDCSKWYEVVNIKKNVEYVSIHNVDSCYRFFRIYITQPSSYDNHARLFEFEIWGRNNTSL